MSRLASGLREEAPEVIYSDGTFRAADPATIAVLKARAAASPRRRCRICFHHSPDATQHAMLIVMHQSSYVQPHRHIDRSETLTVLEGFADAILFDSNGAITTAIAMSPATAGGNFFYYMPQGVFHTLIFRSEWLVFLETTAGPFDRANNEAAPWAPSETDLAAGYAYLSKLEFTAAREVAFP